MERKKITIRIKNILVENINIIHKEENRSIQSVVEELLELGLIEYLRGYKNIESKEGIS